MDNTGNNIRYIEDIPPTYRSVFHEYPCFNTVQSSVFEDALQTDNSLVVAAPTGSGKTAIFEMAIVRLLMINENTGLIPNIKMVYISPMKALCRERLIDWHKKFSDYGIKCISLTSDTDDVDARNISQFNLIISTPEKWDVVTRRWRDNPALVAAISLFMIDEVHLLNADSRGSTLEVIVSRMKTAESILMLNQDKPRIRFIALSATIPNVQDIAEWIGPTKAAKYFKFSEDVRPVKLDKVVYGFNVTNHQSPFKFDLSLNYKLPNLIHKYSRGKPTLIFCSTRKIVEMTTNHLVTNLQIRLSQEQKEILNQIAAQITDAKLRQFIVHGIALHHAGLVPENRNIIESSFRQGNLPILVTTSTLAMGVNLPAHLVIVKGTKRYAANEGFKDYDEVSIFQMIGRAGRSQFDTSATALILTSMQDKKKYEQMLNCTQNIESNLHKHLTEHLNAEIVLKTITDLEVAMNWLSSTFLYVRAKKCPEKYKLPAGLSKDKIDKKLLEICQIDLNKLVRAGMIKMNQAIEVAPTVVGEIMAKYYIAFNTMELFTKISGDEIMIQILVLLSKCYEFSEIHLRMNDKKCLNLLNKNSYKETIRFSLTGKIKTVDMKINCIMQAILGNLDIPDQSILNDSIRVMRNCERLAKCLIEYLETRTKCYTALLNTTILAKCFKIKLWENSPYVSKQLTGVGQVISTLLAKAGKTTFKEIINTNPRHIEMIVGRKAPFGNAIVDEALHLPTYQITLQKCDMEVHLVINLLNPSDIEETSTVNLSSKMTLLIGDSNNNILLYEKYAHSYMLNHPHVTRSINVENQSISFVTADFISEDWVGIDCHFKLEMLSKPTDITSHPTNMIQNSKQTFMDMYMKSVKKGKTIKQVQTISKNNTPAKLGNQDGSIEKEEITIMIGQDKNTTTTTTDVFDDNEGENFSKEKDADYIQCTNIINKNCLEPITELKATSKLEQKNQKTSNHKRKNKIFVAKSIFRTKSKSNQSQILGKCKSKSSKNTESESQFNTSVRIKNFSLSQSSKITDKPERNQKQSVDQDNNAVDQKIKTGSKNSFLKEIFPSKINPFGKNKTFLETHKLQTTNTDDIDKTVEKKHFLNKSQTNGFEKNRTILNGCELKPKQGISVERTTSEDFFQYESQMNAAMDAFEINHDILQARNLKSDNDESTNSDDINILKNFNSDSTTSNENNVDKVCTLSRPGSCNNMKVKRGIVNNTVRNECNLTNDDYSNINPLGKVYSEKSFSLQPSRNVATNRAHMKQSVLKSLKTNSSTSPFSNYPNHSDDGECDNNKKKEKDKNQHFFTNTSLKSDDNRKMDSPNESPCSVNTSKINIFLPKLHNKEDFIQSSQERNPFQMNIKEIGSSKKYTALYNKYNSKIQSNNQRTEQNYKKKHNISTKKDKITEENRETDVKIPMDYPGSISKQDFFRQDFLPLRPKRQRELEDCSSPFEGSQAKRIKWRSPLVHSPPQNFSLYAKSYEPFCFDFGDAGSSGKEDTKECNDLRLGTRDISSSSTNLNLSVNSQRHSNHASCSASTRKKLAFPLCDQDYIKKHDNTFENKIKYLEEICDLESIGLVNKQASSQHDTSKNSSLNSSSAGKYYSQLMSSHGKNLKKDSDANEKTENRNEFAPYESTLTLSQNLPQRPSPDAIFLDHNSSIQCNIQTYDSQAQDKFCPNPYYRNFEKNVNDIDDMDASRPETPLQRISVNDDYGFVNLPKSQGELHPLGNYSRLPLQPMPYLGYHHQPYPDDIMYHHQEIPSPYPIPPRYPPIMGISYHIPRYANSDPYFKEPYPDFKVEPRHWMPMKPMEHIYNSNPRTLPTYHSQVGTVPKEYLKQYSQKSLPFGNNKNQESPIKNFIPTSSFKPKMPDIRENNNHYSNVFSQSQLHEQENHNPQLSQHSRNNFIFEQPCSRSTIFNSQSRSDNNIHPSTSKAFSENNPTFAGSPKNNIGQLFSQIPKQKLQHSSRLNMSQSYKPNIPKTPYPHLVMPSSQGRLLNFNSFEERLDNAILPRNQDYSLSASTEQHYDSRGNFRSTSYQPNNREYAINKFPFSNGRN